MISSNCFSKLLSKVQSLCSRVSILFSKSKFVNFPGLSSNCFVRLFRKTVGLIKLSGFLIFVFQQMGLQNNFLEFDFISKFFLFIWKSSLSWTERLESELSKVNSWFLKIPKGRKMERKSLNYFSGIGPRDSSYCSRTGLNIDNMINSKFL